jgi:hypothetical protein
MKVLLLLEGEVGKKGKGNYDRTGKRWKINNEKTREENVNANMIYKRKKEIIMRHQI